jgi:uncharacterized damage-inducible protein DinB
MNKQALLAQLDHGGEEMEEALRDLGPEMLTASGVCGTWSFKDVLAHLAVNDDWTAEQLEGMVRGDGPPSAEQLEQWAAAGLMEFESRNRILYRANRFRPAEEIVQDVARTRRRLIAAVAALPEARLGERAWFTGPRTVGEAVAHIVEHAREHRVQATAELVAP